MFPLSDTDRMCGKISLTSQPLHSRRVKFQHLTCLHGGHECFGIVQRTATCVVSQRIRIRIDRRLHSVPLWQSLSDAVRVWRLGMKTALSTETFSARFPERKWKNEGGAVRDLCPLRGAPMDGLKSKPFSAVRTSAGCAPNDHACLALAAPASPACHHRSARSAPSAGGVVFCLTAL